MSKRGNPNWGKPVAAGPVMPSEFEIEAKRLRLTPESYVSSVQLRIWCQRNRNRCYIPEWLLKEWNIDVDTDLAPHRRSNTCGPAKYADPTTAR